MDFFIILLFVVIGFLVGCGLTAEIYSRLYLDAKYDKLKSLVILDVNGLLVHRQFAEKLEQDEPGLLPYLNESTMIGKFRVWDRPQLKEFIDFLFEHYRVAIWSSAWPQNVDLIVQHVFGERRKELLFEWSQVECKQEMPHPNPEKAAKKIPLFVKELSRVARQFPAIDPATMLIVDDCRHKMKHNHHGVLLTESWAPHKGDGLSDSGLMGTQGIAHAIHARLSPNAPCFKKKNQ